MAASNTGPTQLALPLLINELAAAPTRHILVLDDYQAITDRTIHESVEFFVSYLPPTAQVVIASRWDPPLPLARMRARGELVEVRANDLRFSEDEAAAMVAAVLGVRPRPARCVGAVAADGRLAGRPPAGRADPPRQSGSRAPRRPGCAETTGTCSTTSPARCCPLSSPSSATCSSGQLRWSCLSGSLCDAALEVQGSAALLAELERADMFVVALDADREWYRCHRLLRDALQRGPGVQDATAARDVLTRAAAWFADHGRIDEAVRHLQLAGDDPAAASLLLTHQSWFFDHGWAAAFLAHGERLAESAVEPPLALVMSYAAKISGHPDRITHWLDACERRIDADTVIDGWRSARAAAVMMRGINGTSPGRHGPGGGVVRGGGGAGGGRRHGRTTGGPGGIGQRLRVRRTVRRRRTDPGRLVATTRAGALVPRSRPATGRSARPQPGSAGPWGGVDRVLAEAAPAATAAEQDWGDAAAPLVAQLRIWPTRVAATSSATWRQARVRQDHAMRLAEISAASADARHRPGLSEPISNWRPGIVRRPQTALLQAREVLDNEPTAPFVHDLLRESEARIGRVAVRSAARTGVLLDELTDREMSILRMLPGSASQREIGAALFLSINTVKAYNKSLYRKLGAASRQEAVTTARRLGLI